MRLQRSLRKKLSLCPHEQQCWQYKDRCRTHVPEKWNISCHISKQRMSQPPQMVSWWALRKLRLWKHKVLAPDSWGAYQRNDFTEPRLLHLPIYFCITWLLPLPPWNSSLRATWDAVSLAWSPETSFRIKSNPQFLDCMYFFSLHAHLLPLLEGGCGPLIHSPLLFQDNGKVVNPWEKSSFKDQIGAGPSKQQ